MLLTFGEILGKLYDESAGTIEEDVDGWFKITSGNVTGYVKSDSSFSSLAFSSSLDSA